MGEPVGKYLYKLENEEETYLLFLCPGCGLTHPYIIRATDPSRPKWSYNGDEAAPTFSPSLLVNKDHPQSRCHLFVEGGRIRYLQDCHHDLRGQTIDLPAYPSD
jgi:hypothetical protein